MSRIKITTAEKKIPVTGSLYGIFLEDINRAVDGGLYPEMLRNRTFEDSIPPVDCFTEDNGYAMVTELGWHDEFNHGEGLTRWVRQNNVNYTPIPAWYAEQAEFKLDLEDTLNEHRQAALEVEFREGGRIYNTGYCKMSQKSGEAYHFYIFVKSEKSKKLIISVRDGETVCSAAEIDVYGDEYTRYDAVLTANRDTQDGIFDICCPEGGRIKIGFMSLMPADTFMGHGLRKDIAQKLKALKPAFFRFPGGCIVEGFSPSTAMRFKKTVGPVWERPGQLLMWHYRSYNGLGFHEYLQFCEDLDMEPLYVFNCGMTCQARKSVLMEGQEFEEMLQDTLDAIEYAVGSADSKWGALRTKMGHPEPYKLNYVEIGNENFGPAYEERYIKCYNAVKQHYPWIKCVANTHVEKKGLPVELVDEHYYNTAEYFAENTQMYDSYDRKGPEIFLGEVSVVRGYVGQLYGALGEAAFFTGIEKNQDIVTLASYAPLLENVDYNAWFPNLIRFNHTQSYGIPSYYVWKLFGNHRGDQIVALKEETERIVRPLKGLASLLGEADVVFRNAMLDGKGISVSHELMGKVVKEPEGYIVKKPTEEQRIEAGRFHGVDPEKVFVVFGDEDVASGKFDIDIKADTGREIIIGIFSSRMPKEVYISDETHPPKEWNAGNVRPFLWKLSNGLSSIYEQNFPDDILLDDIRDVKLNENEFNHFSYTMNKSELSLYANDELLHKIPLPSFPALNTVVSDTDKEVIIKMVNMAEQEDEVEIELDCEVLDQYKVFVLSGDKCAENSFDNPENIRDKEYSQAGAARKFIYKAPPYSVNVLRLIKTAIKGGNNL